MANQDLSSIPIDIGASKLLDWLISRHHSSKDWPEKIESVRLKINAALQDMPENDTLAKILSEASPINYYHCVKIVNVLKETEADSKNIFGMYGSRRMKDWQEIVKLYQKNNLHLAEAASILGRTVTYEIPAFKRLNTKLEQRQTECLKQGATAKKQAQDYRDKFHQTCGQLGLKFENFDPKTGFPTGKMPTVNSVGYQLVNQMNDKLPEIFNKLSRKAKLVEPALVFYKKFLKATIGFTPMQEENCCSVLSILIEKGNVTVYEWKYGEPPVKVEVPELNYSFADEDNEPDHGIDLELDTIDFGDLNVSEVSNEVHLETGEIDWGDLASDSGPGEIDFSHTGDGLEFSGIVVEEDGIAGGVAKNEEALTILENLDTRNQFIDDLYELQGFLSQRIDEDKNVKSNDMIFSDNDDAIRTDNLEGLITPIADVLSIFGEMTTKQYLLVREAKRYITKLAENLLQNLKLANKLEYTAEQCAEKHKQYEEEIKQITPKVQLLTKQCRELQAELVKEISRKYDNRNVYITGGV